VFNHYFLQICQTVPPNLACAILILISEVSKSHPRSLRVGDLSNLEKDELSTEATNDSDVELEEANEVTQQNDRNLQKLMKSTNISLVDPDRDKELEPVVIERKKKKKEKQSKKDDITESSKLLSPAYLPKKAEELELVEKNKTNEEPIPDPIKEEDDIKPDVKRIVICYNPQARNPSYAGAELVMAHELMALAHHFHPSVALFAQTLISKKPIKYDGNPLKDFTLSRFLERFVYRNAKKSKSNRPEYRPRGLRNIPVNSEGYLQASEESIPPEEKFFYKYFTQKKEESKNIKEEEDVEELSDTESVGDDEFDDLMKNYFKSVKGDESDDEFDNDNESVDFAAGISSTGGKKKKGRQDEDADDSEEDDEADEDEDIGDIDDNDSFGDDFIDLDGEDDGEDPFEMDEVDGDGDFDDDDDILKPPKVSYLLPGSKCYGISIMFLFVS